MYFIFGSEELSRYAGGVAELIPDVRAGISRVAASALGLANGDLIKLELDEKIIETAVRVMDHAADDVVLIPVGMENFPPFIANKKAILKKPEA
jgi:hypothetical protein